MEISQQERILLTAILDGKEIVAENLNSETVLKRLPDLFGVMTNSNIFIVNDEKEIVLQNVHYFKR